MKKKGHGQMMIAAITHLEKLFNTNLDAFDTSIISAVDFRSFFLTYFDEIRDVNIFVVIQLDATSFGFTGIVISCNDTGLITVERQLSIHRV